MCVDVLANEDSAWAVSFIEAVFPQTVEVRRSVAQKQLVIPMGRLAEAFALPWIESRDALTRKQAHPDDNEYPDNDSLVALSPDNTMGRGLLSGRISIDHHLNDRK